jgi:hypothetical protein
MYLLGLFQGVSLGLFFAVGIDAWIDHRARHRDDEATP